MASASDLREFVNVDWEDDANTSQTQDVVVPTGYYVPTPDCDDPVANNEESSKMFWFAVGTSMAALTILGVIILVIVIITINNDKRSMPKK